MRATAPPPPGSRPRRSARAGTQRAEQGRAEADPRGSQPHRRCRGRRPARLPRRVAPARPVRPFEPNARSRPVPAEGGATTAEHDRQREGERTDGGGATARRRTGSSRIDCHEPDERPTERLSRSPNHSSTPRAAGAGRGGGIRIGRAPRGCPAPCRQKARSPVLRLPAGRWRPERRTVVARRGGRSRGPSGGGRGRARRWGRRRSRRAICWRSKPSLRTSAS